MGVMRFVVSPPDRITPDMAQLAYMSGLDRIPWRGVSRLANGQLIVEREISESGNLFLPWPVEGHGMVTLATACLMERQEPYHLPLELARGEISQFRNQQADWRSIGLDVPEAVSTMATEATGLFAKAVGSTDPGESARLAEAALTSILNAVDQLASCYVDQAWSVKRASRMRWPWLGVDLGTTILDDPIAQQLAGTFNAARVPLAWSEIETSEGARNWEVFDRLIQWCRRRDWFTCGGPLLQLGPGSSPDWLYLFEDDFAGLQSSVSDYVEATVSRYRGQVDLWQCAGRPNTAEFLSLDEEEMVQLTAHVVEQVHSLDPRTPLVIGFDQPWSEYVARRDVDFPPVYFADALLRANLGISGLLLEMNMGYAPGGTLPRDPLDFSRQLDAWSGLGVPLYVSICVPSGDHADPLARRRDRPVETHLTPQTQQDWLARYLPIALAKPYVHGVFWSQLHDCVPHDFAHGGLFDFHRRAKPALATLTALRHALDRSPADPDESS
ncbi:MAG: hypothetical protein JW888_04780 [Pirellulales bacterium]|nr:hypothetical protein [Pirellulales bacterium]